MRSHWSRFESWWGRIQLKLFLVNDFSCIFSTVARTCPPNCAEQSEAQTLRSYPRNPTPKPSRWAILVYGSAGVGFEKLPEGIPSPFGLEIRGVKLSLHQQSKLKSRFSTAQVCSAGRIRTYNLGLNRPSRYHCATAEYYLVYVVYAIFKFSSRTSGLKNKLISINTPLFFLFFYVYGFFPEPWLQFGEFFPALRQILDPLLPKCE